MPARTGAPVGARLLRHLTRPAWISLEPTVSAGSDAPSGTPPSCALLRLAKKLLELLTFRGTRWNLSCTVPRYAGRNDPFLSVPLQEPDVAEPKKNSESRAEAGVRLAVEVLHCQIQLHFFARQDAVATSCSRAPLLSAKPVLHLEPSFPRPAVDCAMFAEKRPRLKE